jgi:hypothetical protein
MPQGTTAHGAMLDQRATEAAAGAETASRKDATARGATMRESSFPLGLIGMLATLALGQRFFAHQTQEIVPTRRVEMSWRNAACAAVGPEGQSDILCLGDSRIKLGVLPRVLEARLNLTSYNLALLGGQAPSSYFLFRRLLERGSRPRALFVDFSETLLAFSPSQNAVCLTDRVGPSESLEVAWHSRDPTLAVSTALHKLLPGWCDRGNRSLLLDIGSGTAVGAVPADDPRVFERNWRVNLGAQVAPREFVAVEESPGDASGTWRPHPANAYYVDQLLRVAQAFRIAVYWILPPSVPARRERLTQNGESALYRQFVAERVARFPSLTVLDGERLKWGLELFRDPLHVNRDGAVRLSLAVASAAAPRLRGETLGPRWIDLALTDDREAGKYQRLVEDLNQSKAAITPIVVGQNSKEGTTW